MSFSNHFTFSFFSKKSLLLFLQVILTSFVFGYISNGYDSLSVPLLQQDGSYILVNKTSKRVINNNAFEFIGRFHEGIAFYEKGGKYGFIHESGKVITDAKYNEVGNFHEGFARVSSKNKFGFINAVGGVLTQEIFDNCGDFQEGLACVKLGKKWGYIDIKGKVSIDFLYDDAGNFKEGLANVKIGNLWGYINKSGVMLSDGTSNFQWKSGGSSSLINFKKEGNGDSWTKTAR